MKKLTIIRGTPSERSFEIALNSVDFCISPTSDCEEVEGVDPQIFRQGELVACGMPGSIINPEQVADICRIQKPDRLLMVGDHYADSIVAAFCECDNVICISREENASSTIGAVFSYILSRDPAYKVTIGLGFGGDATIGTEYTDAQEYVSQMI